ncbi:hypothetical protein DFH09DRAFT_1176099 [Mycena vulgaris]|nr:hypothetical protein DFH09DRAFT_1176099 [Mycena vulgaris]
MGLSEIHTPTRFDEHIDTLIKALVIPGVCLTFIVLCTSAYASWHPVSRQHLNRVSFRLLVYALIANLIFGIAFLNGTLATGPSVGCSFEAFLVNLSLTFSGGLFFCMALNLQLVLVHEFNGQKLEKYYILGTAILCAVCNITPYASGQFGWNTNQTCWFRDDNRQIMLRWLIGTQSFWVILMATGEVVAFVAIVGYIVAYELVTRRFRQNSTDSEIEVYYPGVDTPGKSQIVTYRNVILRIGLYPLFSCLVNFSTCFLDLYQVKNPILTELVHLSIYAIRPLIYAMLAATDPVRLIFALEFVPP